MNKLSQHKKATTSLVSNQAQTKAWEENCQSRTVADHSQISLIKNRDEQLKQLAKMVQQNPPLSRERQLALTRLVNGILQSGRLFHPQRSQFSAAIYQDIYDEVLQELLLYICQNIHKYEPERGSVMTWVNILLSQRFFKQVVQKRFRQQRVPKMTVTNLYHLAQPESEPHLTEILKKYIDSDPEHLFKQKHIANYPAVNFQALVQRRISGKSWKNISAEFGINISTVSTFYYRCIRKFSSKLKEYCINHVI